MAFLRNMVRAKCRCGKLATVQLVNRFNGVSGEYCGPCGKRELLKETAAERTLVYAARKADK